jgi:hypothetical protein
MTMQETLGEFIEDRRDWLKFHVVRGQRGGWDVMLRIDGAYSARSDADRLAEYFTERFSAILKRTIRDTRRWYPAAVRHGRCEGCAGNTTAWIDCGPLGLLCNDCYESAYSYLKNNR